VLPWWPKEATINLASEETLTLAGSSRYRWRNHIVMGGGIISLQVAASVGISIDVVRIYAGVANLIAFSQWVRHCTA
jgi:hypothetical protein